MKRLSIFILALWALSMLTFPVVWAQQATIVQQSTNDLTACATLGTANGTAQQTVTITPPAGQYVYVCGIDFQYCASGSAPTATNNVLTTTTGFASNPKWGLSVPVTVNVCYASGGPFYWPIPLKSANPGTAITVVSPAAITNVTFNINVTGYFAP